MKYYSEIIKKMFDTPEALQEAEQKVIEDTQNAKAAKARYAKQVEDCEQRLLEATKAYDEAVKEFNLKCAELRKELIEPAQKEVNNATQAKYEALREFNQRYGMYTKYYSDEEIGSMLETIQNHEDPFVNLLLSLF